MSYRSRSAGSSVGPDTVMRCGTLEVYAVDAGFSAVDAIAIEHDQFRLYRLV